MLIISCFRHLPKRKIVKILAVLLGVPIIGIVLILVFHDPLLRWGAEVWIVDHSSVEKVDAVIIPGGGVQTRPFAAADWYHKGKCKRLVTFSLEAVPTTELGISQPAHEWNVEVLTELKVPQEAIEVIGNAVTSTQDEVIAIREWADKAGVSSIAIMTEIFPSRRVDWAYRNGFEGSDVKIHVVALPPLRYTEKNWWKNEEGLIDFHKGVLKYFYYLIRY